MFALLTYDIPSDKEGIKRRNALYSLCKKHGYHVQNSVFELTIDYSLLLKLQHNIEKIIDTDNDSVRIYNLGKQRNDENVILLGKREFIESNDSSFVI